MAELAEGDAILEITKIVDRIISIKEKSDKPKRGQSSILTQLGYKQKETKKELPDYYDGYRLAADWLCQIRVHSEKGNFPYWLFENNSPNMTEPEKEYVKNTYRQDTLEVFKDFVDTMGRAYHEGNYTIEWRTESDQYIKEHLTLKEYATEQLPYYKSLETFVFEFLAPLKLMDAEGIVAILPGEILTIESEGQTVVDPSSMLSPYPEFFHCTKVVYNYEDLVIIESKEYSEVEFNGKKEDTGFVFWAFTDEWYYQIRQVGKKIDNDFEVVPVWQHDLRYLPLIKTGGITIQIDDTIMEQSPFLYAVDTLDRILIDSTLLSSAKATCCYPYRVMIGDPCEATMKVNGETLTCMDGYFRFTDGTNHKCDTCHGFGTKDRVTPTGMMLIKPPQGTSQGDGIKPSEALFYASPSTETLTKLRQEIDYNFVKAYNMLHLRKDNSNIQQSNEVTATEIANENKALIASITTNSRQLFEIYKFLLETLGKIRYSDNLVMPAIHEPVTYDFVTVDEYMKQVSDAVKSGQPSIFIQALVRDAANRIFFKDPESQRVFELLSKTDRLIAMTETDINIKQTKRLVENWEVILHDSGMLFVDELEGANPKFWEQPFDTQKQQLVDKAKTMAAAMTPVSTSVIQTAQQRLTNILQPAS